ncbi:MAG: hypothetical protein RMY29_015635 [Nostoc sp. CreGUA01]
MLGFVPQPNLRFYDSCSFNGVQRLINGAKRLVNGAKRLINGVQRLVNGAKRFINKKFSMSIVNC